MSEIRVLYVIDSLDTGGAETLLCRVAREMDRRGLPVTVVTLFDRLQEQWRFQGTSVRVISLKRSTYLSALASSRALRAIIEEVDPHVVHSHLFPANLVTAIATARVRHRSAVFHTEHNEWNRRRDRWLFRVADARMYSRFDKVISVSRAVEDALLDWIPGIEPRSLTIPNAVDIPPRRWRGGEAGGPDLLFVGRLAAPKGADTLLRAVKLLKDRGSVQSLAMIGYGPLREELEKLTAELDLTDNVRFLGRRSDIEDQMLRARLLVLPSVWEGLPMVLLEGMALGMPVVATRVAGLAEVIVNGRSGLLVEPSDPEGMADAMLRVLTDSRLAGDLGRQARKAVAARYSIEKHVDTLLSLYEAEGGRSRPGGRVQRLRGDTGVGCV